MSEKNGFAPDKGPGYKKINLEIPINTGRERPLNQAAAQKLYKSLLAFSEENFPKLTAETLESNSAKVKKIDTSLAVEIKTALINAKREMSGDDKRISEITISRLTYCARELRNNGLLN